jgi:multiple sugar transport system permease protein
MKKTGPSSWMRGVKGRRFFTQMIVLVLLLDVAFIFMVPILRVLSQSLMDIMDLYDPTVVWLPRRWALENFSRAYMALDYTNSFKNTLLVAGSSALLQTISCALAGYSFARFQFPGRDRIFLLVLFVMIVPPHALIIQNFILVSKLKWLETYYPFIVPSAFGMGLRGALFIFIYRQFFKGLPWELEDAAMIDGASPLRIFFSVMLPLARPAILVVFLFSFVWHWNDSLEPSIFLSRPEDFFLPQRLSIIESALETFQLRGMWGTGTIMAATLLVILPLIVLYIFTQRYFVESIERTGLID